MEQLSYSVEDRTIAELLGVQNFSNKESAILELIKNAYDAGATEATLEFSSNHLQIIDNGRGMSRENILELWMHVGKSEKGYSVLVDGENEERVLAGSKGIGRFALARLGCDVVLLSKREGNPAIKWETDWEECIIDNWENTDHFSHGCIFIISNLRDRWTKRGILNLAKYLAITYNDTRMRITIHNENTVYNVIPYYSSPHLGRNYVSSFCIDYDCATNSLQCSIASDEFDTSAKQYSLKNLKAHHEIINVFDELISDKDIDLSSENLQELLLSLGNFSADFYFSLKSTTQDDKEKFLYKHRSLPERYDAGVVLYRNAFSLSSLEGFKDWLGLDRRVRQSPAAATHATGSWRVRSSQLSGQVRIDKQNNADLKDLSNRQGLDENESYHLFTKIIVAGIAVFERYRQSIVKDINKKNTPKEEVKHSLVTTILSNPDKLSNLSSEETEAFMSELSFLSQAESVHKEEKESFEQRYRYDVRILNTLATSGLKAASIAHEIKNDRNNIALNSDYIVNKLKILNMWEELCLPENTRYANGDVPRLLESNQKVSKKILVFINTLLSEIEKQRFDRKVLNINKSLQTIKENWVRDYAWLDISIIVDEDAIFNIADDILTVIFDNLLLNSVQQNEREKRLEIIIEAYLKGDILYVNYQDKGVGLPPKYIKTPMRILEVHETSRKDGHGLGMWILNNTVTMTGGDIYTIDGNNGFMIDFSLGGELS